MEDKYLVQTRSQSKSSGINLPEVQRVDKGINPHIRPEKQALKPIIVSPEAKTSTWKKPRLGHGRAGLRRKVKVVTPSQPNKPAEEVPLSDKQKSEITAQPQAILGSTSQTEHIPLTQTTPKQSLNPKMLTREVPPYPDPQMRPTLRLPDLKKNQRTLTDLDIDTNTDFEEDSPYQEGIISESYQRPDKSHIREPQELGDLFDTSKLVKKFLPKQTDIDKILEIMQRKENPGWIFDKLIFQRFLSIFSSEYVT